MSPVLDAAFGIVSLNVVLEGLGLERLQCRGLHCISLILAMNPEIDVPIIGIPS